MVKRVLFNISTAILWLLFYGLVTVMLVLLYPAYLLAVAHIKYKLRDQ